MLIADLAIFREWATTTPLSVGIESCSLKYFSDTKFVYRKIVELNVFAWTNIVTCKFDSQYFRFHAFAVNIHFSVRGQFFFYAKVLYKTSASMPLYMYI